MTYNFLKTSSVIAYTLDLTAMLNNGDKKVSIRGEKKLSTLYCENFFFSETNSAAKILQKVISCDETVHKS